MGLLSLEAVALPPEATWHPPRASLPVIKQAQSCSAFRITHTKQVASQRRLNVLL